MNRLSYLEAKIISKSLADLPTNNPNSGKTFDEAVAPAIDILGLFGITADDVSKAVLKLNSLDDPMIFMDQSEIRQRLENIGVIVGDNLVDIPVLRDYEQWAKEIAQTRENVIKDTQTVEASAGKPPADIYADAKDSLDRHRTNLEILLEGTGLTDENLTTMEVAANETNSTLEISLVWLLEDIQRRKG